MSEDKNKLQQMLEQATSAENLPDVDVDPEARSLREAWVDLGRRLEASQPASEISLDRWKTPRPSHRRRWLLSTAALVAASLLIGVVTTWMSSEADRAEQTAAINPGDAALVQQGDQTAAATDEPQWDDSLDEQIAQVGWEMIYARQDVYGANDGGGLIQDGIEQMQKELEENNL